MSETPTPRELLGHWLGRQLDDGQAAWLDEAAAKIAAGAADRNVYMAVSLVTRKIGKADLALAAEDRSAAERARTGWKPDGMSADQAARLYLVLVLGDPARMAALIEQLCVTGDVGELVTFNLGLPLYPEPKRYLNRARKSARTNMKAVFNALAHRNPYPFENFDELAWNHLVLKALFVGSPLWPMEGLDERANAALSRMLCDYAHERWAAGRPVSPELWRCVGRHADAGAVNDLKRVLLTGDAAERRAAALALSDCPLPEAGEALAGSGDLTADIAGGRLSWNDIRPA